MSKLRTTVGQLVINEALPEDLRDYSRTLDKAATKRLLQSIYDRHPEQYSDVLDKLMRAGQQMAQADGASFSLDDLLLPEDVEQERDQLRSQVKEKIRQKDFTGAVELLNKQALPLQKRLFKRLIEKGNPFAIQVLSGSRGNEAQLRSIFVGDVLALDDKGKPVPFPILKGYGEGLNPAEYWAGTYAARSGLLGTKFATADAGAWGKQVSASVHRVIAGSAVDPVPGRGVPLRTDDADLVGYVLAENVGKFKAGDVIDSRTADQLRDLQEEVLVHSPLSAALVDGAIPRKAFGIRERGGIPRVGDSIGTLSAQAVAERISQTMLGSKHGGSIAGNRSGVSGFALLNQLIQVPKSFKGGAAVTETDGRVERIEPAPQGGTYVRIAGKQHYVSPGLPIKVSVGDAVEAGDVLSEGYPNPATIVQLRGIGEGRRQFADLFLRALRENNVPVHRRNIDVLARGLINQVRINDMGVPGYLPGDVAEYDSLEEGWEPREGAEELNVAQAGGTYLESPALWYTIGTRITPSVQKNLTKYNVSSVQSHRSPPPFEPVMVRALENLSYSPDWAVRLGGSYLQRGLTESVHRGRESSITGTSYLPAVAAGEL